MRGPIKIERYFHCKNSLDSGSPGPYLMRHLSPYSYRRNILFASEVDVPIVVPRRFHSCVDSRSLNPQGSSVDMTPQYHFQDHAVPGDFVAFYSHPLLSLQPSGFPRMLQYPGVHIGAIAPRVPGDILFYGRGIVFDYLGCAQGLLFPGT